MRYIYAARLISQYFDDDDDLGVETNWKAAAGGNSSTTPICWFAYDCLQLRKDYATPLDSIIIYLLFSRNEAFL